MTTYTLVPDALRLQAPPGVNRISFRSPTRHLAHRRATPLLGALLLGFVLTGCGGSDSVSSVAGGSDVATKAVDDTGSVALKAEPSTGQSGRINTIETIVEDMAKVNDFVLRGYESQKHGWYVGPGETHMGNNPSFRNSPFWSTFGNNSAYNGRTAKAMLPWLAVFDGVNHNASNVAVEFRNMRVYIKSRSSGEWKLLGGPAKAMGINYGKPGTGLRPDGEDVVSSSETNSIIRMGDDRRYFWHGWWNAGRRSIEPGNIGAIFVTVQARLVAADSSGQDQRAKAQLGLQVGADYYLETSTDYGEIAPNIGISRTKKLTNDWQAFNYTTLSDVGDQIPGGGITQAEFRAKPPPLE